jgi:thiol-disulfide isomerase/thioredoxin
MTVLFFSLLAGVVILVFGIQLIVAIQARKQRGRLLRAVKGPLGEAITSGDRILAYFYSPLCTESRTQTPIIDALSREYEGIFKVNVAEDFEIARAIGVRTTPTTVIIEGGAIRTFLVGPHGESALREALM